MTERASESPAKAGKEAEESAYEKLRLDGKLTIKRPAPEKPAPEKPAPTPEPAPERERNREQAPEDPPREDATSVPALPGPARDAPAQEAPRPEVQEPRPPEKLTPPAPVLAPKPSDNRLLLTVPRLGLANVTIGDSPRQSYLDREGIMHLSGTGFPFKRGSNTYIAGHAGDYERSRVPNVFRNLGALRRGDLIALRDATGKTYRYRVYERLVVNPRDVWVTEPVAGKNIVSLQTCFPAPTYEKRLIVRGELVE